MQDCKLAVIKHLPHGRVSFSSRQFPRSHSRTGQFEHGDRRCFAAKQQHQQTNQFSCDTEHDIKSPVSAMKTLYADEIETRQS